jgi:SAM-dependent methyltransferase
MRQEALETVFLEEVRRRLLATEGTSDIVQVRRTLISIARLLGIFRSKILCREYLRGAEPVVMSGPFSGMRLRQRAVEGASLPKLLGSYEHELHETIEAACRRDIDLVVNLGCADGYYAVGLARRMPNVTVVAVDIDEEARDVCAEVAALNGVEDRVRVSAELGADELQALLAGAISQGRNCLVLCDTEGAEDELLDPASCRSLSACDVLVELHAVARPGITSRLPERFAATHDVTPVACGWRSPAIDFPEILRRVDEFDRLLALWEWREPGTSWAWMPVRRPS